MAIKQIWDSLYNEEATKNLTLKKALGSDETSVFIYDLNRNNHITFNLVPNSLAENYRPRFSTESSIWGRSTPLHFYTGGDSKTLSFSFSIHEDLLPLHNTNKFRARDNIYDFLDIVKELSSPVIVNRGSREQTLKPPQVYLQIGNQFAGKGFIETSWNYSTPYRDGRYIKIDMDLSFTYDIEYETPETSLLQSSEELITQDYLIDIDESLFDSSKFGNKLSELVPIYLDYDYLRTYVYETQKLHNQYSYTTLAIRDVESAITESISMGIIRLVEREDTPYTDISTPPYLSAIAFYFQDLIEIVNPLVNVGDRVRALTTLNYKVRLLRISYDRTNGSYYYGSWQMDMTKDEQTLFETELVKLETILATQLTILQQVIGGGD